MAQDRNAEAIERRVQQRVEQRIEQRVAERIRQRQSERSRQQQTQPRPQQLTPPPNAGGDPDEGFTIGRLKRWAGSAEGGGAMLTRIAGDVGGSAAGAYAGGKLGLLAAPYTMGLSIPIGAISGAAVGGYFGGKYGEKGGQALEGRDTQSPEALREQELAGLVGTLPMGLGRAKTPMRWAIKSGAEGAGAAGLYDVAHQTQVEGKPLDEVDLKRTALSTGLGAGIGSVMGRVLPSTRGAGELPPPPGTTAGSRGSLSPRPVDPSLTPAAAREAVDVPQPRQRELPLESGLTADDARRAVQEPVADATAAQGRLHGGAPAPEAPRQGSLRAAQRHPQESKLLAEKAKLLKEIDSGQPHYPPEHPRWKKYNERISQIDTELTDPAAAAAARADAPETVAPKLDIIPDDPEELVAAGRNKLNGLVQDSLVDLRMTKDRKLRYALRKYFLGEDLNEGQRASLKSAFASRKLDMEERFRHVQNQMSPFFEKNPQLESPTVAARKAQQRAARLAAKAKDPGQLEYTATPNGERAAHAKAKALNKKFPGSEAKAERVQQIIKDPKTGKERVILKGWKVTSKLARLSPQAAKARRAITKEVAQARQQGEIKPQGQLRAQKPAAAPQQGQLRAKQAAPPDDAPPPLRDEDFEVADDLMGEMPEDLSRLLDEEAAAREALSNIPTKMPKGSVLDDWDQIRVGTKELTQDFARRIEAEHGYKVWISPGKAVKGRPVKGWEVNIEKKAYEDDEFQDALGDLFAEYGVGQSRAGAKPSPWEMLPTREAPRPGRMDRPDRGVKLRSEEAKAGPRAQATIGDVAVAKGQLHRRPKALPEPPEVRRGPYTGKPVDQEALKRHLVPPSGARAATRETVTPLDAKAVEQRLRGMSDDDLLKTVENTKNPDIQDAASREITRRNQGGISDPTAPPNRVAGVASNDIEVARQEVAALRTQFKGRDDEINAIRDQMGKASSVKQGFLRGRLQELLHNEEGFWRPFGSKKPERITVLDGEAGLNKVLDDQHADLAKPAYHQDPSPWLNRKIKRWYDDAWNLRVRVNEAIADGQVWIAENNPLVQARLHRGGRTVAAFEKGWDQMMQTYETVRKAGLEDPFLKYMNLSINERAEATAIQHATNARAAVTKARDALADAKFKGAPKKELKSLTRRLSFAEDNLEAAKREWERIEGGRGLQGGYKPGESRQLLDQLKTELDETRPGAFEEVAEAADVFARLHDEALTDAVESGIISEKLAAQYRKRGAYVAPMMRLAREATDIAAKKRKMALDQNLIGVDSREARLLMKFEGETRSAKHPVTSSMLHLQQVVRQNAENKLAVNFVDEFRKIDKYAPFIKKVTEGFRPDDPNLAVIPLWRNGREEFWTLHRDLAEIAMSPGRLDLEMMGLGPLKALQSAKRLMTRSTTTWRPAFLFGRNPPRDIGESRFNLPEIYRLGDPNDYQQHVREYFAAVRDLLRDPRGMKDPGSEASQSIQGFMASGAAMSTLQRSMRPESFIGKRQLDQLQRMGRKDVSGVVGHMKEELAEITSGALHKSDDFASAMEMASKLVSWRRLKAKGYSDDHAAYLVRTFGGSPDFSVGGEMKPFADLMMMFFNPSLRGIEQTVLGVKRMSRMGLDVSPGSVPTEAMKLGATNAFDAEATQSALTRLLRSKGPSAVSRAFMAMAAGTVAQVMWNMRDEFKDENGEPYINRIPAHVRNNNYVVFAPGAIMHETEYGMMPFYFTIAKPHSRVLFQSPMEKAMHRFVYDEQSEFTGGDEGTAAFMQSLALDSVESASPIQMELGGDQSLAGSVVSGLSSSANPLIGGAIDLSRNTRSMTGGPIVGRREQNAMTEDQFASRNKEGMVNQGVSAMNRAYQEKFGRDLGIPPAYVDYMMQRLAPGLHAVAGQASEGIRQTRSPESYFNPMEKWARSYTILGDVTRSIMGPSGGRDARLAELSNDFHNYADRARRRYGSALLHIERDGLEAAREYYRMAPPAQQHEIKKAFDTASDQLSEGYRKRGDAMVKLVTEKDPEKIREYKTIIQQMNNRELVFLRNWRERMDAIEGKTPSLGSPAAGSDINLPKPPTLAEPVAGAAPRPQELADQISQEMGVDPALVQAMMSQESNGNPNAESHRGAQGLMQLMPGTARAMGVTDPFDPEQNLRGGVTYIKQLLDEFGSIELALAAYNAGPGAVRRYGGVPPYEETQEYVRNIMGQLGEN